MNAFRANLYALIKRSKYFAVFSLLLSSIISLFRVGEENLCIDYLSSGHIVKFNEIESMGNGSVIFVLLGLIGGLFSLFLALCKNKVSYGFLWLFYLILSFLMILFTSEVSSFSDIVRISILYCQNWFLLVFLIGQVLFIIFSLFFIYGGKE